MGNFRSDDRGRGFGGNRFGGGSRGGFNRGGNRGGGFERREGGFGRPRPEMHDVVCDKCGKNCQVPFKPTGDKPVLCSDCFQKNGGSERRSFNSNSSGTGQSISSEQFNQLNAKVDKILEILENVEFEEIEGEEDEEEDSESAENQETEASEETEEKAQI